MSGPIGTAVRVLVAGAGVAGAIVGGELLALRRSTRRAATGSHGPADAIVILGATADASGPSPELAARLDHGARLWRAGLAPVILVAGGVADRVDEADVMADHLAGRGIPRDAVAPLRPAGTTREAIRSLAGRSGPADYLVVSSPFHARRIEREARRHGVRLTVGVPAVTPVSGHPELNRLYVALELVAIAWYALPEGWTRRVHTGPGSLRRQIPIVMSRRIAPQGARPAPERPATGG